MSTNRTTTSIQNEELPKLEDAINQIRDESKCLPSSNIISEFLRFLDNYLEECSKDIKCYRNAYTDMQLQIGWQYVIFGFLCEKIAQSNADTIVINIGSHSRDSDNQMTLPGLTQQAEAKETIAIYNIDSHFKLAELKNNPNLSLDSNVNIFSVGGYAPLDFNDSHPLVAPHYANVFEQFIKTVDTILQQKNKKLIIADYTVPIIKKCLKKITEKHKDKIGDQLAIINGYFNYCPVLVCSADAILKTEPGEMILEMANLKAWDHPDTRGEIKIESHSQLKEAGVFLQNIAELTFYDCFPKRYPLRKVAKNCEKQLGQEEQSGSDKTTPYLPQKPQGANHEEQKIPHDDVGWIGIVNEAVSAYNKKNTTCCFSSGFFYHGKIGKDRAERLRQTINDPNQHDYKNVIAKYFKNEGGNWSSHSFKTILLEQIKKEDEKLFDTFSKFKSKSQQPSHDVMKYSYRAR